MLKLSVTAKDSPVNIQDPRPVHNTGDEQASYTVDAGTTKEMIMSWDQLERIGKQVEDLEALGLISFIIEGTDGPVFTEQPDNPDIPIIDYVSEGVPVQAGDLLDVFGYDLIKGQVMAEASIPGDTVAGSVLVNACDPGGAGNLLDVVVVQTAGALSSAIAVVAGRTVVTVDLGSGFATVDCDDVAGIINNATEGAYGTVFATVVGVGATLLTTVKDLVPLLGGIGGGLTVTLAGIACVVNGIDVSGAPATVKVSIATPNYTALSLATGAPLSLQLRANNKLSAVTLTAA